jgi:putative oxidoreductase
MNRLGLDFALLVLRLAGFGLALAHGSGKLAALSRGDHRFADGLAGMGLPAPIVLAWAAALSETVGGVMVGLGLFARVAAAFCSITMAVAALARHHAHDQLFIRLGLLQVPPERLTLWGNPELALVYLAIFLAVVLAGPGGLALDAMRGGGRRR